MTNMQLADGSLSDTSGAQSSRKAATQTCVGSLTRSLPAYVRNPPIEAAVFAWGVAEDGQLVRCCFKCRERSFLVRQYHCYGKAAN